MTNSKPVGDSNPPTGDNSSPVFALPWVPHGVRSNNGFRPSIQPKLANKAAYKPTLANSEQFRTKEQIKITYRFRYQVLKTFENPNEYHVFREILTFAKKFHTLLNLLGDHFVHPIADTYQASDAVFYVLENFLSAC